MHFLGIIYRIYAHNTPISIGMCMRIAFNYPVAGILFEVDETPTQTGDGSTKQKLTFDLNDVIVYVSCQNWRR